MNIARNLRCFSPAFLDLSPLSCKSTSSLVRSFASSVIQRSEDNKNYKINPLFENRNPRCLERMGLAPKRKGWKFQAPKKDFYHKLVLTFGKDHTTASVVHCKGNTILKATTREPLLAKELYSQTDVSAAWNVGRLIARRMLESGLTTVFFDTDQLTTDSEKCTMFMKALEEANISFEEPEEVKHEYLPGINYDGYNRYNEERKYQEDYQKL